MSSKLVSIAPSASVEDAFYIMKEKGISHLPVVHFDGKMVGMVSERDLLLASPSPVSSVSMQEMLIHLTRLKVVEIMNRDVVTVDAKAPVEEAAGIMIDHLLDALPVMSDGALIGIITESDIFRVFLELLDTPVPAVRLSLLIPNQKGIIASLCGRIAALGGNIVSLGEAPGVDADTRTLILQIAEVPMQQLESLAEDARAWGCTLLDIRATHAGPGSCHCEESSTKQSRHTGDCFGHRTPSQ